MLFFIIYWCKSLQNTTFTACRNNPRYFLRSIFTKSLRFGKYTYRCGVYKNNPRQFLCSTFTKYIRFGKYDVPYGVYKNNPDQFFYVIYLPNLGDLANIRYDTTFVKIIHATFFVSFWLLRCRLRRAIAQNTFLAADL